MSKLTPDQLLEAAEKYSPAWCALHGVVLAEPCDFELRPQSVTAEFEAEQEETVSVWVQVDAELPELPIRIVEGDEGPLQKPAMHHSIQDARNLAAALIAAADAAEKLA